MENIIDIRRLSKSFGEVRAVDDLSFKVKKGELFAFLGENGAGKSTTISIMCGTLKKDEGTVLVCGKNVDTDEKEISKELGVVFQNTVLDGVLSVKDNLVSRASLYGICGKAAEDKIAELSVEFAFSDLLKRPFGKLSGGQKRRIDVARALLNDPSVLVLDEPTTGLDPQTRKLLWEQIETLRKTKNMTVFLTTHYMEEAADADYVVILEHGRIAAEGTPLDLKNRFTGDYITIYNATEESVKSLGKPYKKIRDAYRVEVRDTVEAKELIVSRPEIFTDFEITKGKMDDMFLAVTGKELQGGDAK